jgi:hypothetical protein
MSLLFAKSGNWGSFGDGFGIKYSTFHLSWFFVLDLWSKENFSLES